MDAALIEALIKAAEAPGFATVGVVLGLLVWLGFKNRVIVPGEVAALREELASVKAGHKACESRCEDLLARIVALEHQINHANKE